MRRIGDYLGTVPASEFFIAFAFALTFAIAALQFQPLMQEPKQEVCQR